jgi:glucose/arabinose dehydrogenase
VFGRIRTVQQGGDGSLYVTTDNGGGADRILRVTPRP